MNTASFAFPSNGVFVVPNNKLSSLLTPKFPRKETTDNAPSFTYQPGRSSIWSIRSEGNKKGRPRRSTSSGGTDKGGSPQSSDDKPPNSSNQEEIIALFKRIQASIAKEGGSTSTRKRRPTNPNERKAAESVLDVFRQSRKTVKENKSPRKRVGVPKTNKETVDIPPTPDFSLERPPSNFVKRSPIPKPLILEKRAPEGGIEESEGASAGKGPDLEKMKVPELREVAKSKGIKGYSKMKKGELIELLKELSF